MPSAGTPLSMSTSSINSKWSLQDWMESKDPLIAIPTLTSMILKMNSSMTIKASSNVRRTSRKLNPEYHGSLIEMQTPPSSMPQLLIEKRRNKIIELKDKVGNPIIRETNIQNHILNHFKDLFVTSHSCSPNRHFIPVNNFQPSPKTRDPSLNTPRDNEILVALKSFKPLKAPGPDGLHPLFF